MEANPKKDLWMGILKNVIKNNLVTKRRQNKSKNVFTTLKKSSNLGFKLHEQSRKDFVMKEEKL